MEGRGDGRRGREERSRTEQLRLAVLFHPRREAILRLLLDGREAPADEIAATLKVDRNRIAHHLRVLVRCGVLQGIARGPGKRTLYRWSAKADWARKMLEKSGE